MILAVNIGNTNIAAAVFDGDAIKECWRLASDAKKSEDEYALALQGLMNMQGLAASDIKGAIIGSVVPALNEKWAGCLNRVIGVSPLVMTHRTPIGMENRYTNPAEVGMDRLANAVGGKLMMGAPVIVLDIGTAATLDIVDREGAYAGGCILAGLETTAEALALRTARLPRISPRKPAAAAGKSTLASLESGIFYGMVGAVDGLVERLWAEIGYETGLIATGGGAAAILKSLKHSWRHDPSLTLRGLKAVWDLNLEKAEERKP